MMNRYVEVYSEEEGAWVSEQFQNLVSGTIFHLYEQDGTPLTDHTGVFEFRAASDPYQTTVSGYGDVWQIDVYDPEPVVVMNAL